ncbi:MAG: hypothetical protein O7B30_00380 [Thaumarchaeota archaeon]|nr:hypothetical protein [Nitrososphaerota archaeon]
METDRFGSNSLRALASMLLILDTSFLIRISTRPLHSESLTISFGGYDRVTVVEVISELERIAKRTDRRGKDARLALAYAKDLRIVGDDENRNKRGFPPADERILQYAKGKKDVAIASLDRSLLQEARKNGIRIISLSRERLVGSPVL